MNRSRKDSFAASVNSLRDKISLSRASGSWGKLNCFWKSMEGELACTSCWNPKPCAIAKSTNRHNSRIIERELYCIPMIELNDSNLNLFTHTKKYGRPLSSRPINSIRRSRTCFRHMHHMTYNFAGSYLSHRH